VQRESCHASDENDLVVLGWFYLFIYDQKGRLFNPSLRRLRYAAADHRVGIVCFVSDNGNRRNNYNSYQDKQQTVFN
jgi:hypothetical protein